MWSRTTCFEYKYSESSRSKADKADSLVSPTSGTRFFHNEERCTNVSGYHTAKRAHLVARSHQQHGKVPLQSCSRYLHERRSPGPFDFVGQPGYVAFIILTRIHPQPTTRPRGGGGGGGGQQLDWRHHESIRDRQQC